MKVLAFILIFLAAVATSYGQVEYSLYKNQRYGYSVEFPSNLLIMRQRQPGTHIGRDFVSRDRKIVMFVLASRNENMLELRDEEHLSVYRAGSGDLDTLERTPTSFAFSMTTKKRVYFQKTVRHRFPRADFYYTLVVKYPSSLHKKWQPIIERIAALLKIDGEADVEP